MIPRDLAVTESERRDLAERGVLRQLTGVFWEAVDHSPVLQSHKEHFYSNGILYSTSIDVFLICSFAAFVYAVAYDITGNGKLGYTSGSLIAIALLCKCFVTPARRARHLELSREQLDLIQRDEAAFVSDRFRQIVIKWRQARGLQ
jgi:hypothetical protein